MRSPKSGLRALKKSADQNRRLYATRSDKPRTDLLERFPAPLMRAKHPTVVVNIEAPEFTCLCPMTGQPDFATIRVEYVPRKWCVESKSFKLYLTSFRSVGSFHEAVTQKIADDLIALLAPKWIEVNGLFLPRGGIAFRPRVSWSS